MEMRSNQEFKILWTSEEGYIKEVLSTNSDIYESRWLYEKLVPVEKREMDTMSFPLSSTRHFFRGQGLAMGEGKKKVLFQLHKCILFLWRGHDIFDLSYLVNCIFAKE